MDLALDTARAELELRVIEASGLLADDPLVTETETLTAEQALRFLTIHARARAPERNGSDCAASGTQREQSARAGRPARSDRIDVTGGASAMRQHCESELPVTAPEPRRSREPQLDDQGHEALSYYGNDDDEWSARVDAPVSEPGVVRPRKVPRIRRL